MKIIGQKNLMSKLNAYTINSLPKTMMFIGEIGCGKHSLAKRLANRLGLEHTVIDDNEHITPELIIEYSQRPIKTLYYIDIDKFSPNQQNQFLKFIEEPSNSVNIIIGTESTVGILPTILNRCIKYTFESYSLEELEEICKIKLKNTPETQRLLEVCKTPGRLKSHYGEDLNELFNTCDLLVTKINKAPWYNVLKIITRINFTDNYDKLDLRLFIDILERTAYNNYVATNSSLSFKVYTETNKAKKDLLYTKGLIKETYMINFLLRLWKECQK